MSFHNQCSVALPRDTVGWSAVCDCGISWPYALAFWGSYLLNVLSSDLFPEHQYFKCL